MVIVVQMQYGSFYPITELLTQERRGIKDLSFEQSFIKKKTPLYREPYKSTVMLMMVIVHLHCSPINGWPEKRPSCNILNTPS